jgi:hypothetical protein
MVSLDRPSILWGPFKLFINWQLWPRLRIADQKTLSLARNSLRNFQRRRAFIAPLPIDKNPSNVKKFNWQLVPNLFISTLLFLPCCKTKAIANCFPNCQSVKKDALGKFKGLSQIINIIISIIIIIINWQKISAPLLLIKTFYRKLSRWTVPTCCIKTWHAVSSWIEMHKEAWFLIWMY